MRTRVGSSITADNTSSYNTKNHKAQPFSGIAQISCYNIKTCPDFLERCEGFASNYAQTQNNCGRFKNRLKNLFETIFEKIEDFLFKSGLLLTKEEKMINSGMAKDEDSFVISCKKSLDEVLKRASKRFAEKNGFRWTFTPDKV